MDVRVRAPVYAPPIGAGCRVLHGAAAVRTQFGPRPKHGDTVCGPLGRGTGNFGHDLAATES